jgi:7-carboxy-7-deazaguanine synthase
MLYKVAEKFKSVQGEGVYAGTPMAFIRFVGCSVGKRICQHCDTDFDTTMPWRGGGEFDATQLLDWAYPYEHICFTGGEPLDQDLLPIITGEWGDPHGTGYHYEPKMFHIETSGTREPVVKNLPENFDLDRLWVCVSPKPGFLEKMIRLADEVKVIVLGLGTDESLLKLQNEAKKLGRSYHPLAYDTPLGAFRWPGLDDALRWAAAGKTVFLQPRNAKFDVDKNNLMIVQDIIREHPQLRLSVQLHKILKVQ